MKYLYILTSDTNDNYLEQAVLSIASLRIHMPNAYIALLVDNITESNLTEKRACFLKNINEIISVKIDENHFNKEARSRYLKTSMRHHIKDDFLYIDCDTIISGDLSSIENIKEINIGAVYDFHQNLNDRAKYYPYRVKEMQYRDKKLGFDSIFKSNNYFNSGVIFCRDNNISHDFFYEWHKLWLNCFNKNYLKDQPSFNQANYNLNNIIAELNGNWNCQIMVGGLKFLHEAKIIHYFSTFKDGHPYILSQANIYKTIKETGDIDDSIKKILENPKSQFINNIRLRVIDPSLQLFEESTSYSLSKLFFNTKIGKINESFLLFIKKNIFKPIIKKIKRKII